MAVCMCLDGYTGTYCQTCEYLVTEGIVCGRGEYLVTQGIVCGRGKWLRVYMSRWLHMDLLPNRWVPRERGIVCGPGTYCQTGGYHVTRGIVCGRGKWLSVYMSGWLYSDLLPNRLVPRDAGQCVWTRKMATCVFVWKVIQGLTAKQVSTS
ncbi:hypothetical protein MAR_018623 [Mya arenaria]|uniref:EGF-like domain-containing protein n=1 Tax=Mya arenaria TaxID=6604 RepID=A0ABY7EHR7_MYAAR|nr:hypothetical protein MAR_018623 [Mya arenaria]